MLLPSLWPSDVIHHILYVHVFILVHNIWVPVYTDIMIIYSIMHFHGEFEIIYMLKNMSSNSSIWGVLTQYLSGLLGLLLPDLCQYKGF